MLKDSINLLYTLYLDFGVTRSKVTEVIICMTIVCSRDISRTDWQMNFKLGTCIHTYGSDNDLIKFWGHEVIGQRSQRLLNAWKEFVLATSQERIGKWTSNLAHVYKWGWRWSDKILGAWGQRSKVTGVIICMKTDCSRDISRTDWRMNFKLGKLALVYI